MMRRFTKLFSAPKIVAYVATLCLVTFISYRSLTYISGPPSGYTNAPSDNGNCTSCHGGSLITSGSNWNNLVLITNIPGTGYLPDSVYTVSIKHKISGISRWGFQVTALRVDSNLKAGTLIQTTSGTVSNNTSTRDYINHNSSGTSGTDSILWTFNWRAPNKNVGDIKFYAVVNATNSNGQQTGDNIYAKDFTFSVSSLLPTAVITVDTTSCVQDTVQFFGSGNSSPTQFNWTFTGANISSSTQQNPKVVFTSLPPGGFRTITLRTANSYGQSAITSQNVYLFLKPAATVNPSGTINLCQGDSVTLTANGGSGITHQWTPLGQTSQSIKVKTAGTYTVTVTNSNGCSRTSNPVIVNFNPLPTVTLTKLLPSADTVCKTDTIRLKATGGYTNYLFLNGTDTVYIGADSNAKATNLKANNTFTVRATNSNNCKNTSNSISVVGIQPLATPTVSCGTVTTASITFNWGAVSGSTGYEVSKDTGKTWTTPSSGTTGTSHTINGLTYSQDVVLMVRSLGGPPCSVNPAGSQKCTTLPCSNFTYTLLYDSIICKAGQKMVRVSKLSLSNYSISLNGGTETKDTDFVINPSLPLNNYQFAIVDSGSPSCPPRLVNFHVKIDSVPPLSVFSTAGDSLKPYQVSRLYGKPSGLSSYNFTVPGTLSSTPLGDTTVIRMGTTGNASARLVAQNSRGCTDSTVKTIHYKDFKLDFTHTIAGYNYTFSLNDSMDIYGNPNISWDFGDAGTGSGKNPTHNYSSSKGDSVMVKVTFTGTPDGVVWSTQHKIYIHNLENIKDPGGYYSLNLYPNPVNDVLMLSFHLAGKENLQVDLYTLEGKLAGHLYSGTLSAGNQQLKLEMSKFPKGVYLLKFQAQKGQHTARIILE